MLKSHKKGKIQMINYKLMPADGVLILTPTTPLESRDFEKLTQEIDPYIEANGKLHGLMIVVASFPGWKDFASFVAHLKFIKNHHQKIQKIAVVSDSNILSIAPKFASHFVQANIRHFPHSQREDALCWLIGHEIARKNFAMPSEDARNLVRLAAASNSFQAHIWQQGLEQEGIRCKVLGDFLEASLADLPGSSPEVWVEAADLPRAEEILRQHQVRSETATQPEPNP
jgi:hypothetical protein